MKKTKKFLAGMLAASFVISSSLAAFSAQSVREAWNNAAAGKETGTTLADGSTVYPNVYSDSAKWEAWKGNWETVRNNFEQIALTPGKNETELNFAWYSKTEETPKIRLMDDSGKEIGIFEGTQGKTPVTVSESAVQISLYPSKATATGLTENRNYKYQYFVDGNWSEIYSYSTKSAEEFSVLYVGDPQIGASTGQTPTEENAFENPKEYFARNDAYNWNETLKSAISANPNVSFLLSAGDQINQTGVDNDRDNMQQQVEYAGFLYPSVLRSLPLATTIGNHDNKSVNYQNHFNNPNSYTAEVGASKAGNDYYFTYGNVLFISINTNNYNCQTHKELIEKAIGENPDAVWRILMFHQDIYGSGYDHSDSDGMILRTQLTGIIDDAGIDAVLQGHDHTYSRTYQISAKDGAYPSYDKSADTSSDDYQKNNASCYNILTGASSTNKVINPEGAVYFEANSSTGSKFYQLIGTQQDYIAARSQSWRPTYSVLDFDEVSLTVRTYDAATNEELIADGNTPTAYTIVKSVDKESLFSALSEASEKLADANAYSEEGIANLKAVLEAARKIYDNPESTSIDVASAYASLKEAIAALKVAENVPQNGQSGDSLQAAALNSGINPIMQSVGTNPPTGDETAMFIWIGIAAFSAVSLVLVLRKSRKTKEDA